MRQKSSKVSTAIAATRRKRLLELTRPLLDEMKRSDLATHSAYEPLAWLYYELLEVGAEHDQLRLAHEFLGESGPYVDMVLAEKHYRDWCRRHNGGADTPMSRGSARGDGGRRVDGPCLVYVARKLGVPRYAVAEAWRVRKSKAKTRK